MLKRHKLWMASFAILAALVFGYPAVAEWSNIGSWDTKNQFLGTDNTWTGTQTFDPRAIVAIGTASAPGLTVTDKDGSTDNGIFASSGASNQLEIALGGSSAWVVSSAFIFSQTNNAGAITGTASTSTVPALTFTADTNTGMGRAGDDALSLIAGGVEGMRITEPATGDITIVVLGTAPAASSCGTTPSITGSDAAGKLTIGGGGAVTSCTVTFANAFTTNAPACVIAGDNSAVTYAATTSTTVLTVTSSADMQSDVVSYICLGIL